MVVLFASVAYAATVHGTQKHDWGKTHNGFDHPPGCKVHCGKMIRGTNGNDTIYGREGWDYIGAYGGKDVIHGGPGMEIVQGDYGDDRIFGEMGHDHVYGGPGNDTISTIRDNAVDFVDCGPGFDEVDKSVGPGGPDREDVYVNSEIEFS